MVPRGFTLNTSMHIANIGSSYNWASSRNNWMVQVNKFSGTVMQQSFGYTTETVQAKKQ